MLFRFSNASDMHFLTKQQPALHNDDFLDDWHDRQIAFLFYQRNSIDVAADGDVLDLDVLMGERFID